MNVRKLIQRRIRHSGGGVDIVGDVNAAIAANVGDGGSDTRARSTQRVVQRSRTTASAPPTDDRDNGSAS